MKKILLVVLFLASLLSFSQQEVLAKFIITNATRNGLDVTQVYQESGSYLVFYSSNNDGDIYMANVAGNLGTQSFGRLFGFETERFLETEDMFEYDLYSYKWNYINNYNDINGTATVGLMKVYKPQGVAFMCRIITEGLDILEYKGYMEGSLQF